MPGSQIANERDTTDASTTDSVGVSADSTTGSVGLSADAAAADRTGPAARLQRVCFRLRVRPDRLAEYRERHARVWPEMLREIEASGRRNYSLFLDDEGALIGYFETDSLEQSEAYLAASATAARWEAEMAPFFDQLDGRPDQGFERLPEIFNLADQLASADSKHAQKDIA